MLLPFCDFALHVDAEPVEACRPEPLDLDRYAGATELKKRVTDAATAACNEIKRQYPNASSSTSDIECVKNASDKAMVQVNALIAAAGKKPAQ